METAMSNYSPQAIIFDFSMSLVLAAITGFVLLVLH
jgi:hypothetical protein